jgi:hypothetical protein
MRAALLVPSDPRFLGAIGCRWTRLGSGLGLGLAGRGEIDAIMMLLENKVVVVYGAGGPVGAAVSKAFTREGAYVVAPQHGAAGLQDDLGDGRRPGGDSGSWRFVCCLVGADRITSAAAERAPAVRDSGRLAADLRIAREAARRSERAQRDEDLMATSSLLKRRPGYRKVGDAGSFFASDWAATMTATEVNLTGDAVVD